MPHWIVSETIARAGYVGEAMADVAGLGLVHDVRARCPNPIASDSIRATFDCIDVATADIEDLSDRRRTLHCQAERRCDVVHCTKSRRCWPSSKTVQQPRAKIRQHVGIGIGQGLAWSEHVEQPQR
jgi:hypothetical protein